MQTTLGRAANKKKKKKKKQNKKKTKKKTFIKCRDVMVPPLWEFTCLASD